MKDQLKTIRDGLENFTEPYLQKALTALAQLEAMAGEQEPFAYVYSGIRFNGEPHGPHLIWNPREIDAMSVQKGAKAEPLYRAAPVAQQHETVTNDEQARAYMDARLWEFIDMAGMWPKAKPDPRIWAHVMVYAPPPQQPQYEAGDVASAAAQGFRDGVASVAQQPQEIEVQCPVCNHKFYEWPNDKQPQAEAVPADQSKWCAYVAGVIGCYLGEADDSAKVKAIAGIIERRMWASAHQPLKIAAWRGVHVEGDYLYYDEFPEELTNEQRRQLHLKPLYEGAAPQQAEAVPSDWRSLLRQSEDNFVRQFGVSVSAAWAYRDMEDLFAAAPQQAEAVPVVDRVYEAAKRLVDHADFQLGGVLSAKSKTRDIPSNAASKVKARHLASLRDALAKTPHQAEAVQYTRADLDRAYSAGLVEGERLAIQQAEAVPPGYVLVPVEPTDKMAQAAHHLDLSYMPGQEGADRAAIYRAMVNAAIAQQKGGV